MDSLGMLGNICYYIKEFDKIQKIAEDTNNNNNLFLGYLIELSKFDVISKLEYINNDILINNLNYLNRIKEEIKISDLHNDDKKILYNIYFSIEKKIFENIIYNNSNGQNI